MNEYKITTSTGNVTITAIDEKDARRIFRQTRTAEETRNAYAIDLIRENVPATKQQEWEALEKIKAIVETLGPQSYLATAFEGCFEDAECNIENDFADSMKARWLHADAQLNAANGTIKELKEQLAESERDWEAAHAANHAIAEEKDAEIESLRKRVLSPDDFTDVIQLVTEKRLALETEVKNAADRIVEAAAEPGSAAFQNAVKEHRAAKSGLGYYTALLERLVKVQGE